MSRSDTRLDVTEAPAIGLVVLIALAVLVPCCAPGGDASDAPANSGGTGRVGGSQRVRREDSTPHEVRGRIVVDAADVIREIPRTLFGTNIEWRWNANFLWRVEEQRPDPEIVRLSRELGVTLIRYPGGVYSDQYHWRDGVGPYENRPVVKHQIGSDDESRPDFGTDEALAFADMLGAELLITVNAGSGTAEEAADWVRYVNRDRLRVRYWEVGNELYINDGSVFASAISIDPKTYAERYLAFVRAMREADPRIRIGAIGGENRERYAVVSYPDWNGIVLRNAGHQIDFLSVHNAYAPVVYDDSKDLRTVYRAMLAAPASIRENLRTLERQIRRHVPRRADEIAIAVTEWGPFFQVDLRGRYIDHNKTLGSALFVAGTFKVLLESTVEIANFWHLNDVGVLGWIASTNPAFPPNPEWAPTARYFALQMFTRHFGATVVRTETEGPTFDSQAVGFTAAVKDAPYLEAIASLSTDGERLYIMVINTHFDRPIIADVVISGFTPMPQGTRWQLTGPSIDANTGTQLLRIPGVERTEPARDRVNPRFDEGGPDQITVESRTVEVGAEFTHEFAARSITSVVLERK